MEKTKKRKITPKYRCTTCDTSFDSKRLFDSHVHPLQHNIIEPTRYNPNAPTLVKIGDNLIDPKDVVSIKYVKEGALCIINLRSCPNPEYPFWANPGDVERFLQNFNIIE